MISERTLTFLPGLEDSALQPALTVSEQSPCASAMSGAPSSLRKRGLVCRSAGTCGSSIGAWPPPQKHDVTGKRGKNNTFSDHHYSPHDLPTMVEQASFYSQPEFHASLPAGPGSKEAQKMTGGSGRMLSACLEKSGPLGRFSRILLGLETWASPEFYLTWKVKVTKCGCSVFQLARSAPRMAERGIGSWPTVRQGGMGDTARAENRTGNRHQGDDVSVILKSAWPSPTKRDDKGQTQNPERMDYVPNIVKATWPPPRQGKMTAEEMDSWQKRNDAGKVATPPIGLLVKAWATPKKSESGPDFAIADRPESGGTSLPTQASGNASSGCLARTEKFVVRLTTLSAWLMGYTGAYLAHWATASCRKSRRKS